MNIVRGADRPTVNAVRAADLRLVTTDLAALATGMSEATIRKWASRGKLTRYGEPTKAQYDLAELFLVMQRGSKPKSGKLDATQPVPASDLVDPKC